MHQGVIMITQAKNDEVCSKTRQIPAKIKHIPKRHNSESGVFDLVRCINIQKTDGIAQQAIIKGYSGPYTSSVHGKMQDMPQRSDVRRNARSSWAKAERTKSIILNGYTSAQAV